MSGFCSGLCNEISRCCYDFTHAPFTKKNLLIGGGVLVGLIIIIIIIVVASGGSHHKPPTADEILKQYPLIDGANSLSKTIKDHFMNELAAIKNGLFSNKPINCASCQTDFNRMTNGHVATQIFSVTTDCDAQYEDAVSQTLEQIDLLKRIISANSKKLQLVTQASDIPKIFSERKIGVIINVWGGHNIDSRLPVLRMFYDLGVRIMSIASADPENGTPACVPPWASNDTLSDFGKSVVKEMNRLGMMIDLTGCSMKLQESILSATSVPVIFSHSASQAIQSNNLNVDDQVLINYKDKIGIVMVPFTPSQLSSNDSSTISSIADHLDQFYKIIGHSNKLGIGSNFDNMTKTTQDLEDVSKFVNLISYLLKRTTSKNQVEWTDSNLEHLISANFLAAFKSVEKGSKPQDKPEEGLIPEEALKPNDKCYTDFGTRYNKSLPTAPPTTVKPITTPTTTPSNATTTTKKA